MRSRIVLAAALAAVLLSGLSAPARALRIEKLYGALAGGKALEVASGEALVRFQDGVPAAERADVLRKSGFTVLEEFDPGWLYVRFPEGLGVASALGQLRALPGVRSAEPNRVLRTLRTPNDPSFASQWGLANVNAAAAWEYEVGASSTVTVAIMDSGPDSTHPDLSAKLSGMPHQFFDPTNSGARTAEAVPTVACDHATMVSGVAAASTDNGIGVAGMSWRANLLSIRVFDTASCSCAMDCNASCQAACGTTETTMRKALDYLRTGIHGTAGIGRLVVNISIGGANACGTGDGLLPTAITNAVNAGIVVVAAAGNDAGDVNSPGNCTGVIPVGATDQNNNVAAFSSRGTALANNGVVAPGVGIYTTYPVSAGSYKTTQGTSFSAPLVSGLAALILANKPSYTAAQVQDTLRGSAVSIGGMSAQTAAPQGSASGAGLVNAFRAMRLASQGTLAGFEGDQKAIAFPNPFRPSQHGSATLTVPTSLAGRNLKIKIYTPDGQLVRDLGAKTTWDGRNTAGHEVASGTYLFLLQTDAGSQKGRIAVIR